MEPHPGWTLNTSPLHGQFADNDKGINYIGLQEQEKAKK